MNILFLPDWYLNWGPLDLLLDFCVTGDIMLGSVSTFNNDDLSVLKYLYVAPPTDHFMLG